MKNKLIICILLGCVMYGRFACAMTEAATSVTPSHKMAEVGACRFKIASMFGGGITVPDRNRENNRQGIYDLPDSGLYKSDVIRTFALFCVNANAKEIGTQLGARLINGNWMIYNPWPGRDALEYTRFEPGAHPKTVSFKGSNWTGIGLTVDDTTGDESGRARTFRFCLVHQTHALCGDSPVQWLADPARRNELWKIKAILESVEFIDDLPPAQSSPKSAPASQQM